MLLVVFGKSTMSKKLMNTKNTWNTLKVTILEPTASMIMSNNGIMVICQMAIQELINTRKLGRYNQKSEI